MIRRPPRSTLERSSAASDVYKRQVVIKAAEDAPLTIVALARICSEFLPDGVFNLVTLSLIHISEPTRPY